MNEDYFELTKQMQKAWEKKEEQIFKSLSPRAFEIQKDVSPKGTSGQKNFLNKILNQKSNEENFSNTSFEGKRMN